MKNIYVGNLPYSVQSDELREAFEAYGEVTSAEVIFDRRTKRSRGYGFVEMGNDAEALEAIATLNGSDFQGRELRVDESQAKSAKTPRGDRNNNDRPRSRNNNQTQNEQSDAGGGGILGFVKKIFG